MKLNQLKIPKLIKNNSTRYNIKMNRRCFHKPTFVYQQDKIKYYAADIYGINEFKGHLVINLTKIPSGAAAVNINQIDTLKDHIIEKPKEIILGWEDFMAPPVLSSFWSALHEYCIRNSFTEVAFHCMQGHGRTGTALAAMQIACMGSNAVDAIELVREVHCQLAVENEVQTGYLFDLDEELNQRMIDYSLRQKLEDKLNKKINHDLVENLNFFRF